MEPHRRYHTPVHIAHCLNQFDLARDHMDEPDAVEMALWFHDIIYDARANDNEVQSAKYFVERCGDSLDPDFTSRVRDLIIVTIHKELPASNDEKFMVDIDLSSFGLPWDRFLKDSEGVRDEFPHLSDEEFYPAQKIFLDSLLERKHFCFTRFFRERHEQTARDNITRYLESLSKRGFFDN
jgi:predicted metal-dependent HD superfamily phosphohydrolase